MNTFTIMLIAFGAISLSIATFYFYIFARSKERFIQYWGLCWVCYSCSLLFLILGISESNLLFLGMRKIFDMYNVLFLLFGVYSFQNLRIPGYWMRFSLYLLLWSLLSEVYTFDIMSLYIPTSMFQIIVTISMCYLILRKWKVPKKEKFTVVIGFGLWGFGKAIISIVEALSLDNMATFYLAEIIFSNVLNFLVFIIYLQRAESKLNITKKQFKLIVENALDVIFFYEITPPAFSYITPAVEKVLGYVPQDFYGDGKFYLRLVDPSDYAEINRIFDHTQFFEGKSNTATLKVFLKNSQKIWAEISTNIVYEDNTPIALEGVIRNVTATKNAEEEMLASKKSREVFLSYISHELKTPVTSLFAYITALRDHTLVDETKRNDAFEIIYNKTLILNRLILDVFQISKLETKQFSFEFMVISAKTLLDEILNHHLGDFESKGLKLIVKADYNELANYSIIADTVRMEQVFANIISNAIRFSEDNSEIIISTLISLKRNLLILSVRDYGCGIAEEDLPYIFNKFYQVNNPVISSNDETTGLGMTISKEIVDAHGGTIVAKSRLGKGSTFTVSLPLYNENAESDEY